MRSGRVYADTSVFGGCFDEEFEAASRAFFEQVRGGRFALFTSALVQAELEAAPATIRTLFDEILPLATVVDMTPDALALQAAYLEAGIISARWADDALHVALASTAGCELIVSWNFKHLVHYEKIPLYNAVNTLKGYPAVAIHAPWEMIAYEDEDH